MRHFTAIVNPTAGGSAGVAVLLQVARLLREAGAELETEYSRSPDHAQDHLAQASGNSQNVVDGAEESCIVGAVDAQHR